MKISASKEEKIKENIIHLLFEQSPRALFTAAIASYLARDEEYIKRLLFQLEKKNFVIAVKKNPQGKDYKRRIRWLLNTKVYEAYKKIRENQQRFVIDNRII